MKMRRSILRKQDGAAAVEMAFALPILIVLIWMFVQLAQVYRAVAGIQQALGEGARSATLCVNPTINGCSIPSGTELHNDMLAAVYGVGPGTFGANTPTKQTTGTSSYYDLKVTYTQPTDLLLFAGPTINVTRSKRVWVASN
jgi:hypothetical protein